MTIDTRHWVWCNLGPLAVEPSTFADSYLQGSGGGVITTKGTINLKGVRLLSPGQEVHLAYSDGQNWIARVPRRLRVLNSFANPLKDVTTVLVGCKFAYMQDRKPPVTNVTEAEANSDVPEIDRRAYAQNISAAFVAQGILTKLGLTAASTIPFTNSKIADEWDLSSGFVQELAKIAEAECYRCRINENEQVEFVNLNSSSSSVVGPLIAQNDLIDLTPQTVGELPADTVYAKYESTQLKPPDNDPNNQDDNDERQKRDWEKDESFSTEQYIHTYTDENGETKEERGYYAVKRISKTNYDTTDRVESREETSTELMGTRRALTTFDYETMPPHPDPITGKVPPPDPRKDYSVVKREIYWEESPIGNIASSCGFDGSIGAFRALGFTRSAERLTVYDRDYDTGITKTNTTNKVQFVSTPFGSDEISKQSQEVPDRSDINWLSRVTGVISTAAWLVEYGSEQRIRTEREFGLQKRPSQQERNKSADQKTPSVEQQGELVWAVGSPTSQTALELSPPYVSDDRIIKLGPGLYTVQKSDAAQKALNYARTENRLLLANRSGAGLQLLPIDTPPKPFDLFYVRLNACTAAYRVNGTTWTINPTGFVCTVDGLFWGAIDGTVANAWFPLPPGATVLPATAAVTTNANPKPANAIAIPTGFNPLNPNLTSLFAALPKGTAPVYQKTINPAIVIPPYHETIELTAGVQVGAGFDIQAWIPTALSLDAGVKVGASVQPYNLAQIPSKEISIAANVPTLAIGDAIVVPATVITVAKQEPTIDKFTTISVPASAVQVAAIAPDRAGEDVIRVDVPAAVVYVSGVVPLIETQTAGINVPTAGVIAVAGLVPGINPSIDPLFSSVSLLLSFDGANGSTTFTDSGSNALAPSSVTGSVAISTAQSKYGGASALFPSTGTNYIRYTPQAALQFPGDFTIELWVWQSNYEDRILGSSSSDGNTQVFRLSQSGAGNLSFYLNGTQVFSPTSADLATNTWQHLAICRSGSNTRMFVDGVQKGSTNTTWIDTFRMDVIGQFFFGGSPFGNQFRGHIDDLRITKAARYTANFTPTGPHPLS